MKAKRKSKVRVTHRNSKLQVRWERVLKRVQVVLGASRWVLLGAIVTLVATWFWR